MRTSRFIPTLATAVTAALGACVSAPVASGPAPVRPMQLTIVRPEYDKVLVQTNRYAYVALFEILPDRGVSIVYPATAHQASESLAGMHWLPVSLQPNRVTYRGFPPRRVVRDHYLYAIASDVPFHISDSDYDPRTLASELGDDAYRGGNVAATMRALAREFGPALPATDWAEDSYALEEAQETPVVRVYCGDDEAIEIRETIVARVNCSSRPPTVYGNTGSSGRSGGYAPPRSGPAPVASNPTPAPTPTPRAGGPWAPFPRRDSVTQAGTPRDSIRRPPALHLPGGTWPASDSSAHGSQSGGGTSHGDQHDSTQADHGRGNGHGDDDHQGHDNGRGNGGVPGNGGVNAGGQGNDGNHGNGNNGNHGNGQGNNGHGSDNGRGNGGIPGNGGVNAGGDGHGNGNGGSGNASSGSTGNSSGSANAGSHGNGNGQGNGSDNGRGNGGVPGNGGVNVGNGTGNGSSNGNGSANAGNGSSNGNASSSNGSSHGNGNGNGSSHGNATPGIGDANPHGSSPTVNGNAPRLPFGLRMPTQSPNRPATAQPAPAQQPASTPAQQPTKTDSAKPAPPRHMMPPVRAKPDSSDKKPNQQ